MDKAKRAAVIAGNWKMNKTPAETTALINEMKPLVAGADCKVVLCVPFVDIAAAVAAAEGSNIEIGAENVHFKESGAYTGEVSAKMLTDCGVKYVVVGHSERRQYFGETDATVSKKVHAALDAGLLPIICVQVLPQSFAWARPLSKESSATPKRCLNSKPRWRLPIFQRSSLRI